jgi:hypothetical protein
MWLLEVKRRDFIILICSMNKNSDKQEVDIGFKINPIMCHVKTKIAQKIHAPLISNWRGNCDESLIRTDRHIRVKKGVFPLLFSGDIKTEYTLCFRAGYDYL